MYEVKFSPDIDARGLRYNLLNRHSATLGRERTFDGTILFLPMKLPEKVSSSSVTRTLIGTIYACLIFNKQI